MAPWIQWALALAAVNAGAGTTPAAPVTPPSGTTELDVPACVHYWGEARYRYPGYDHVVHVENGCARRARCAVSTNVDPQPIVVAVAAHTSREVITRRTSPARELTPYVDCTLESEAD